LSVTPAGGYVAVMAESGGDRELIVLVSRDLVASVAPEEMPLFTPLSSAYFDAPERLERQPKDDVLGFGVGEVVVALTPIALSVVAEVLTYLRRELAQTAAKDVTGAVDGGVRSLFRRFHHDARPAVAPAALSREQLAEVGRLAYDRARAMRLSEPRARLLADAVVGSLALGS
jgi:hypothetical protein